MGNGHETTTLDRARDELMSHVVRCNVLDARMDDRNVWLDETMKYMEERYRQLSRLELAKLEMLGRQFIQPAIPHGKGNTAMNRPEATVVTEDGVEIPESEADARGHEAARSRVADGDVAEDSAEAELQPA